MNGVEQALIGGVDGGTAILLPALGELIGERAGVVNLGTEGCMLAGALSAYAVGRDHRQRLARGCSPASRPAAMRRGCCTPGSS